MQITLLHFLPTEGKASVLKTTCCFFFSFFCMTLCIAWTMPSCGVRLSVTFVYCTETSKYILKLLSLPTKLMLAGLPTFRWGPH